MQSSFFAHFMCFEVPALVPPGGLANGNKTGHNDDDTTDDLGIMDIDDNETKAGKHFLTTKTFLLIRPWPGSESII